MGAWLIPYLGCVTSAVVNMGGADVSDKLSSSLRIPTHKAGLLDLPPFFQ